MHALHLKIPPPVLALLIAAVMWYATHVLLAVPPTAFGYLVGGPVALFGGTISAAGLFSCWRARTTVDPLHPERACVLVTSGVFRISRNPMYVGLVITLAGWAIHLLSAPVFLGPVVFAVYIHHFQVLPEERILAQRFGHDYEAYRAQVRRWL